MGKHPHAKQHTNFVLTAGVIVAVLVTVFMMWQRTQMPHEAFPIRSYQLKEGVKKRQPSMPVTTQRQQP